MDRSRLKALIQHLYCRAAENAGLPRRYHHAPANRTPRSPGVAQDKKRLCGGPDSGSSRHDLSALLDLPTNVRSMVEMEPGSPCPGVGKFLDFLGGQESTRNEPLMRCAQEDETTT
jgi:hypothetical protein